jgi:protein gp37
MAKYYDRCWNPIFGCTGNFAGCDNCFAKSLMQRRNNNWIDFNNVKINRNQFYKTFDKESKLIAVCTQSDLFQDKVSFTIIDGVLRKCNNANHNRYLFLTKYADNLNRYFNTKNRFDILNNNHIASFSFDKMAFGVSVCVNDDLHRIDTLKSSSLISHRFIAFEPVLEKINLTEDMLQDIEWIIVGAETGNNKRYCNLDYIISIVELADKMNIPVFVNSIHLDDGKVTSEFAEMPTILHRMDNPYKF